MKNQKRSRSGVLKLHNAYAAELGSLFAETPKAVLAAIAVSYASMGGDSLDQAKSRVAAAWQVLFENGIVPQKPSAKALKAISEAKNNEVLP